MDSTLNASWARAGGGFEADGFRACLISGYQDRPVTPDLATLLWGMILAVLDGYRLNVGLE